MLRISFEFDEVSQKISNLKVESANAIVNKEYDLRIDDNKIELTSSAVNKLKAIAGDRISVNYWTVDNQTTYPIISKSEVFTDGADGNKLTKKGTVSFKGQQRTSLLKFGSLFTFSEFKDKNGEVKDNVFILTPVDDSSSQSENDFTDVKESMEELEGNRVEDVIDEILGEDNEDALPF
jgi:hypothetical protein